MSTRSYKIKTNLLSILGLLKIRVKQPSPVNYCQIKVYRTGYQTIPIVQTARPDVWALLLLRMFQ